MAAASARDIKKRIRSMRSTAQITKAMELVAASKLRRRQQQVERVAEYVASLREILQELGDVPFRYCGDNGKEKALYIVIAGDRGLAGGYNYNVWKALESHEESLILPIGRKAVERFPMPWGQFEKNAGEITVADCRQMGERLCKGYLAGEFGHIFLVYTAFCSVLRQETRVISLLPLARNTEQSQEILYEPSREAVWEGFLPEYLGGMLYGCLCQSLASEEAARRMAMDAATQNARERIDQWSLKYNRARQAAITQQITEIVAGL